MSQGFAVGNDQATSTFPEIEPPADRKVAEEVESFNEGRVARVLQIALWFAVGLILLLIPFILISDNFRLPANELMFISGLVTTGTTLLAFLYLLQLIPETVGMLWQRGIISSTSGHKKQGMKVPNPSSREYEKFIVGFKGGLNSPGQLIIIGFFIALELYWRESFFNIIHITSQDITPTVVFIVLLELGCAALIGAMAWRMLVVGYKVMLLGKRFYLALQPGHPDRCGGLKPLGNLCFWNFLIAGIPGIFLSSWIVILRAAFPDNLDCTTLAQNKFQPPIDFPCDNAHLYLNLFPWLLLIPVGFSIFSFWLPLLSVHSSMISNGKYLQQEMNRLAHRISIETIQMIKEVDDVEPSVSQQLKQKIALMQETYDNNYKIPDWPFSRDIIIKYATSLALPILNLTGLQKPIIDLVGALLGNATK